MRGNRGKSPWEFHAAPSETFIAPRDARLCAAGDSSPWELRPPLAPFPGRYEGHAAPSPPRGAGLLGACFTARAVGKEIQAGNGETLRLSKLGAGPRDAAPGRGSGPGLASVWGCLSPLC